MGLDEAGTLQAMRVHRAELWDPAIASHGGRVVGTAGDSLLIEYSSVVAAVEASIAVQEGMVERNATLPEDRRMLLRIGINIGEVIIDGDDIFGDGVNVAARLQEIATTGGIAMSGKAHEEVADKLEAKFADDGPRPVKNIARPIQVWRWPSDAVAIGAGPLPLPGPVPLPDKPSIAVLPLTTYRMIPNRPISPTASPKTLLPPSRASGGSSSSPAIPPSLIKIRRWMFRPWPGNWACATFWKAACARPETAFA